MTLAAKEISVLDFDFHTRFVGRRALGESVAPGTLDGQRFQNNLGHAMLSVGDDHALLCQLGVLDLGLSDLGGTALIEHRHANGRTIRRPLDFEGTSITGYRN